MTNISGATSSASEFPAIKPDIAHSRSTVGYRVKAKMDGHIAFGPLAAITTPRIATSAPVASLQL